jgi:hypothetical protein
MTGNGGTISATAAIMTARPRQRFAKQGRDFFLEIDQRFGALGARR